MLYKKFLMSLLQLLLAGTCMSSHPDIDGLISFYQATDGENWTNTYGWKEGTEGISCDPCNYDGRPWYGLQCENNRVTKMDMGGEENFTTNVNFSSVVNSIGLLEGNNLKGDFPQIYLPELKMLKLSKDSLLGPLPDFIGLPKLEYLLIREVPFESIPDFSSIPNLKMLFVFRGTSQNSIPNFSNVPNLKILHFWKIAIVRIPNFDKLSNLEELILSQTFIPQQILDFSKLTKLRYLDIVGNFFEGNPPSFDGLDSLEVLGIGGNFFSGEIPNLDHLTGLKEFYCGNNNFSGCFPNFICNLDVFHALRNESLPWGGDHLPFCNGQDQIGSPCTVNAIPTLIDTNCRCTLPLNDYDGDGYYSDVDCDESNAQVNPGQVEIPFNFLDDDCNPLTLDWDQDQDGFPYQEDCDDNNPNINPSQPEIIYNGIDDDCDSTTLDDDLDEDGFLLATDCNDNNPNINPDQTEEPYNGIDDDCDSATLDDDIDQDGFLLADDCNDNNPNINPDKAEIAYNGIDDDCSPTTLDDDLDQDGFAIADDCDDNNPNINPAADDIPNNGIDEDCDGMDLITSTQELSDATLKIYPNPAIDLINIELNGQLDFIVSLYDMQGKLISRSANKTKIKLELVPEGTYLIEVKDLATNQKIVDKIVVGR